MKKIVKYIILIIVILTLMVLGINYYVIFDTKDQIIKNNDYSSLNNIDCIIVLGAGVWGDRPSPMLEDRILEGVNL